MRVGYIAEPYEEEGASGMGYAVMETLNHLLAQAGELSFIVYSSKPVSSQFVKGTFKNCIVPRSLAGKLLFFLRPKGNPEVLMFVTPLLPLLVPSSIKTILMCKELGSQKIRPSGIKGRLVAFFRDRILMPVSLARATIVVTPSEATKTDLVEFYHIDPDKIRVIPEGYQDLKRFPKSVPTVEKLKPFFFFTGKLKPRKNVHGIVAAFILFKKHVPSDVKLVIGGVREGGYYQELLTELERNQLSGDVYFPGYVPQELLAAFFNNAIAFVFPSLNEGFGMPIVEAMSLGTPVITSNISSTAEVGGDAALLVDPHSPEDISSAMERVYRDESLRTSLIAKGLERSKLFSWERAANEYIKIITVL